MHKAERFADLKDTLEASLGIGRLSHRAMAAPMKVFAEDPYVALLNQTFHPSRLQPAEAVRAARNVRVLSIASLIGDAISRTAAEESVSSLFD